MRCGKEAERPEAGVVGAGTPFRSGLVPRTQAARSRYSSVFLLLGAVWVALGLLGWSRAKDPAGVFLVAGGALLLLVGVGFYLAATRFFPGAFSQP